VRLFCNRETRACRSLLHNKGIIVLGDFVVKTLEVLNGSDVCKVDLSRKSSSTLSSFLPLGSPHDT